jgi:hypothetical protein
MQLSGATRRLVMTAHDAVNTALRVMRTERVMRTADYARALAFMNEKGVLEEFVDRELAAARATHPVADKDIRLSLE